MATSISLKRSRWQLMLAVLLLFAAQLVVDLHLTDHTASGDNSGCPICAISGGTPGAPSAALDLVPITGPTPAPTVEPVSAPIAPRVDAANQARAPPYPV
jgi:hypothetical protein